MRKYLNRDRKFNYRVLALPLILMGCYGSDRVHDEGEVSSNCQIEGVMQEPEKLNPGGSRFILSIHEVSSGVRLSIQSDNCSKSFDYVYLDSFSFSRIRNEYDQVQEETGFRRFIIYARSHKFNYEGKRGIAISKLHILREL